MTNRIKSASVAVFANDTQIDRAQAFGVSARLDQEDLLEIGNLDIVEVIDNVPTVDITVDANQYGSVKTLAKFAKKNYNWGTTTVSLKDANTVTVSSGQFYINEMKYTLAAAADKTVSAPTGSSQTRIDVVSISTSGGVFLTAGTAVFTSGTPAVPTTPAGCLRLALVQRTSTSTSAAVDMTYLSILNAYDSTSIALRDFELASVDFTAPVKETGDNTDTTYAITRTMSITDAYVNRYDAAFSVNGTATESWSLESDNKTWFLNTASTLFVDRFQGTGSTSAFTLSYAPTLRDNGKYTVRAYKYDSGDATYTALTEATDFTVTGTSLTLTAPASDQVLVVRYPTSGCPASAQPFFKRVPTAVDPHPVIAGGLKHGQVEIYLSDDASNHVLRLQSVSISCSLTREALYEIGHKRAYDRPMTFPIPITVQVEALASDLKEFARLCGKTFATVKELSIDGFLKNLDLTVKIYREDDVIRASAPYVQSIPLKTITVSKVSVTDENTDTRVEGNATQSFGFKASTNLTVAGLI
jgi:hypothetical protein